MGRVLLLHLLLGFTILLRLKPNILVTSSVQWHSSWLMLLRLTPCHACDSITCLSDVHALTAATINSANTPKVSSNG